jgi:FkbM family methyltransferase
MRAGTSDASTIEKIFVWNGYDLDYPEQVRTVVDAGANIGASSLFFAARFPDATVFAIEPEARNHERLLRNVAGCSRIVPIRAALWSHKTTLGLSNPDDRVDSYRFAPEATTDSVRAISIPALLEEYALERIDVLKVDIEGAEVAVFSGSPSWVEKVRIFVVELHGAAARDAFGAATAGLVADRYRHGEDEVVRVR